MSAAWATVQLGEVLAPVVRERQVDPSQEYPLLGVRLDGQGPFHRETVLGTQTSASRLYEVKAGDFIYSRLFAWRGAFGLIEPELDSHFVSNEFPTFAPRDGRIDPKYLRYWFRLPDILRRVEADCSGSTPLTRNRYKEQYFCALEIPLPPLGEQRRIVARIEELAAKVEEARELRSSALDELAALRSAQSRRVFESLRAATVPLEMVCSAIIDNLHSNPIYAEGGTVPCIRSSDVEFGVLDLAEARRTDEAEYRRRTVRGEPQTDDIVLVREGGGTGKCALVLPEHRFSLGQRVMMLRPDRDKVLPKFFLYQLLSPTIQEDHVQPLSKGSASPHLNIGSLRQFPFLLPSVGEQAQIVESLDALQAKLDAVKALQAETAAELDAVLPAILDKAFKGEL